MMFEELSGHLIFLGSHSIYALYEYTHRLYGPPVVNPTVLPENGKFFLCNQEMTDV